MARPSYLTRAVVCVVIGLVVARLTSAWPKAFLAIAAEMATAVGLVVSCCGIDVAVVANEIRSSTVVYVVSPVCVGVYGIAAGVGLVGAVRRRGWCWRLLGSLAVTATVLLVNVVRIATCVGSREQGGDPWFRAAHDGVWPFVDGGMLAILFLWCARLDRRGVDVRNGAARTT